MRRIFAIMTLLVIAMMPTSAQYKMQVELNNGYITDYYVSEIKQVIWSYDNPAQSGNDEDEPTVTGDATDITNNSATITAWANNILDNNSTDLEIGIIYTDYDIPSRGNGELITISKSNIADDGKYSVKINGLLPVTTYYYRSFVFQSGLYFYGAVKSFTTRGHSVSFETGEAGSITCFSAKLSASIVFSSDMRYSTAYFGICYDTIPEPTTASTGTRIGGRGNKYYTCSINQLYGGTVYYYRPYAVVDGYVYYGQSRSFRTTDDNVVETGKYDEKLGTVTSKLTIGGGNYSTLQLGVCWGETSVPTINNITARTNEVDENNCYTIKISKSRNTIFYRAYVLIDGIPHYGSIESISGEKEFDTNGYEYVDLGLSVLWATCNVGAEKPEDYGDHYAWGEIFGKGLSTFDWSYYKYSGAYHTPSEYYKYLTKYCTYGDNRNIRDVIDNKIVLESIDDVANVWWGGNWRMPTDAEWKELLDSDNCTWQWTSQNGVNGYKVTSKKNGYTDNFIFLPASGRPEYNCTSLEDVGSCGFYWSSSLDESNSYNAWGVKFDKYNYVRYSSERCGGKCVRPVW